MFLALFSVYFLLVFILKEANVLCSMSLALNLRVYLIHCNVFQQRGNNRLQQQLQESDSDREQAEAALWHQIEEISNERDREKEEKATLQAKVKDLEKMLQERDWKRRGREQVEAMIDDRIKEFGEVQKQLQEREQVEATLHGQIKEL